MATYRAYVLDVTAPLAPVTHVTYVQGEKYANAWQNGRAALDAGKRGKAATLYSDADCKIPFKLYGDAFTFVRADDMRQRNVKIDVAALRAVLVDPKTSDAEKLNAAKKLASA